MAVFIFCIVSGAWCLYNFVTLLHPEWMLPFFRIAGDASPLLRVVNMIALNWSPIIGVVLLIFGVVGLKVHDNSTNNFEAFKYFMAAFAFIMAFALML